MIKDEALKLALEALQLCTNAGMIPMYLNANQTAIAAIEEALAQPEQEPVALPCCGYADASAVKWNLHNQVVQCHNCGQVYETPPQRTWVGLTDEDKHEIELRAGITEDDDGYIVSQVFKLTEAKLKEKNT
jgi:hypothetical protein